MKFHTKLWFYGILCGFHSARKGNFLASVLCNHNHAPAVTRTVNERNELESARAAYYYDDMHSKIAYHLLSLKNNTNVLTYKVLK